MALYDVNDLVTRCQQKARRPTTDESQSAANWRAILTEVHQYYVGQIAAQCPGAMFTAPELMTSSDGGATYTIPTLESALATNPAAFPLAVEIRASRNGRLLLPGPDWDPRTDFIMEGTRIRTPNGKTRTYASGPVARYILMPGELAADGEPTLKPVFARQVLVPAACERWAREGGFRDPEPYRFEKVQLWSGDPDDPTDLGILGALKLQFDHEGNPDAGAYWWRSGDLGG